MEHLLVQSVRVICCSLAIVAERTKGTEITRSAFASFADGFNMIDLQNCPISSSPAADYASESIAYQHFISHFCCHSSSFFGRFAAALLSLNIASQVFKKSSAKKDFVSIECRVFWPFEPGALYRFRGQRAKSGTSRDETSDNCCFFR